MVARKAIAAARAAIGAVSSVPGQVWTVRRLDRPGAYELVVLGQRGAATAVVAIDAQSGETMSSATLPGRGDHLAVEADEARRRAGASSNARADLVWAPSTVSRSMLYPFWEVSTGDDVVYVDQQGTVSRDLGPSGRGG